jgi:putative FmdB family regulatory protein
MKSVLTMPIYEYICEDCGSHYERLVLAGKAVPSCPKCSSKRGALQLSVFSAKTKSNGNGAASESAPSFGGSCCGAGGCGCN